MITRRNVGGAFCQRREFFQKNWDLRNPAARSLRQNRPESRSQKRPRRAPTPAKTLMPKLPILIVWWMSAFVAGGAEATTALSALKLLPKGQAKNVAMIEAHEGTPMPERWHVLVHDKQSETGVREYVIAGGEIVVSRNVSQFAQSLTSQDVIGVEGLKCDSDRVAQIAQDYAMANNITPASINYKLGKDGPDAAPLWRVTCLDESGNELGNLVLTAAKGNVVSHDGFQGAPIGEKRDLFAPQSIPPVAGADSVVVAEKSEQKSKRPARHRRAKEPPSFFRRVGGKFQKFFTGENTIGH